MLRTFYYHFVESFGLFKIMFGFPKCKQYLKNGDVKSYDERVAKLILKWSKECVRAAGAKVNVSGLENLPPEGQNFLLVSNHQSNLDIQTLIVYIPRNFGFVAKKELGKVPLLGFWMRKKRCLFMDRADMKQSMQTIIEAGEQLKKGYTLVIFPEGTRSKGGPVKDFKGGSLKPALKAKVPIVPVTIDGTYLLTDSIPGKKRIRPAEVNLVIHKYIDTSDLTREDIKELPVKIRQMIVDSMTITKSEAKK